MNRNVSGVPSNGYYYMSNVLNNSNSIGMGMINSDKGKYEWQRVNEMENKVGNKNITANEYFNELQNKLNSIGSKYNYSHNNSNSKFEMSKNIVKQRESMNDRIKKEQEYQAKQRKRGKKCKE